MFIAEYSNGRIISEEESNWHDLSEKESILMVLLCNENIVAGLYGCDEYWFANEAVAGQGFQGTLIAQILGGKKGEKITEIRQNVKTGELKFFDHSEYNITADHKPGGMKDESPARANNFLTRLFRGRK